MEEAIIKLKQVLETYKKLWKNADVIDYKIYYEGAVDALSKAIDKLES